MSAERNEMLFKPNPLPTRRIAMQSLMIKDLSVTEELDAKAMTAVRGGCYGGWKMPSYFPSKPGYEHPSTPSSTTTDVSISQQNNQMQSNATGNGSVVFGGGISAFNNQQGFNVVG
jgi:hypothetical protein